MGRLCCRPVRRVSGADLDHARRRNPSTENSIRYDRRRQRTRDASSRPADVDRTHAWYRAAPDTTDAGTDGTNTATTATPRVRGNQPQKGTKNHRTFCDFLWLIFSEPSVPPDQAQQIR